VTFVDADRRAQALIAENLTRCGIADGYAIIRASADRAFETLRRGVPFVPFTIILLDPPYELPATQALAGVEALVAPGGLVVLEHARRAMVPDAVGGLVLTRNLVSGDSALTFYACQP
jgi:16S rRNA (guanine966-N2)-methyltransferase